MPSTVPLVANQVTRDEFAPQISGVPAVSQIPPISNVTESPRNVAVITHSTAVCPPTVPDHPSIIATDEVEEDLQLGVLLNQEF